MLTWSVIKSDTVSWVRLYLRFFFPADGFDIIADWRSCEKKEYTFLIKNKSSIWEVREWRRHGKKKESDQQKIIAHMVLVREPTRAFFVSTKVALVRMSKYKQS